MTVFIHVKENPQNFAILLVQLQPQLREEDDLYIVDSTPNREGFRLAKLYGSTRSFIFIEVGDYSYEKALEFGQESQLTNNQNGLLVLSENSIISNTFISNVRKVFALGIQTVCPIIQEVLYDTMPNHFRWYNSAFKKLVPGTISNKIFLLSNGDKVGVFEEEVVLLMPTPKDPLQSAT